MHHKTFQLLMCSALVERVGGGGRVSTLCPDSMAASGLAVESPWLALGGPLLLSFARIGLETVFCPCRASIFLPVKLFSWPVGTIIDQGR